MTPTSNDNPRSWLVPDHLDRERMLDMDRRLAPVRLVTLVVLGAALLAAGPWVGYWTLVPLLAAGLLFWVADARISGVVRSELPIFAAWVGSQIMITISVLLAGESGLPFLAWFAIPVVTLSARFSYRGIALGVAITLALLIGVSFASDAGHIIDEPTTLFAPVALVIAVAILSSALMRSDVEHRSEAVVDPLTGMLNRKALANRVEELRQQAAVSGAGVGVIVADIDHFKRVNDTVGHAAGDAVLREVAYIIRKSMRAYELAYRLGGEEFLVLLPGAETHDALRLAEEVRGAIASARFAEGTEVTVSCGIAASDAAREFDFDALFAAADAALYRAKIEGRDRVEGAIPEEPLQSANR